jgi:DNA-binding response OmpR family regulator
MKRERICLLIDDDLDDQEFFAIALTRVNNNFKCELSASGTEAIKKLNDTTLPVPDFIFLDLNMPKMNGKECLREIKSFEHLNHIPVVIYSTSSLKTDVSETKLLGASEFITKPFSMNELVAVLDNFFQNHKVKIPLP